jgi:hypothetical protein
MLPLNLTIVESDEEITGRVLDVFRSRLNTAFKHASIAIKRRIGDVCDSLIKATPEYNSLLKGELLGELGVPNIEPRLAVVLLRIRESIVVESTPIIRRGSALYGGIVVKVLRSDFEDILALPEASYETKKGVTITWLDWLIRQGDTIIVLGYDVEVELTPKQRAMSRTGLAVMVPGSGWRVPPEFSGVPDNNFLTRAFDFPAVEHLFLKIMEEEIVGRV